MGDKDGRKNDVFHPRRKIVTNIVLLIFIFLIPIFFNFLLSCPLVSDSISRKVSIVSPLAEQKPFVLSQYRNILNFIIFNSFSESEILIFQVVVFVQKSLKNHLFHESQWYRWLSVNDDVCRKCHPLYIVECPCCGRILSAIVNQSNYLLPMLGSTKNPLSKLKRDWQTVIYWTFENLNSEI